MSIVIKVTAVVLAVLLWFNVVTDKSYEYELTLPINSVDLPAGLALVSQTPDSVTVKVLAHGKKLLRSDWKKAGLRLQATRLRRGNNLLEINSETVTLIRSEDVGIIGFPNNSPVPIQLDRLDSLYKPVASKLAAICDKDYIAISSKGGVTPNQVQVIGPASFIRSIDTIYTESSIVDDIDETSTFILKLETNYAVPIRFSDDSVAVELVVDKKSERTYTAVPLMYNKSIRGKKLFVEPERIDITITGPATILDSLSVSAIQAVVLPPANQTGGFVIPHITLPANVSLESLVPDSVRTAFSQ